MHIASFFPCRLLLFFAITHIIIRIHETAIMTTVVGGEMTTVVEKQKKPL